VVLHPMMMYLMPSTSPPSAAVLGQGASQCLSSTKWRGAISV
jgi:hypothetical protein